jgi:hypothetical protein
MLTDGTSLSLVSAASGVPVRPRPRSPRRSGRSLCNLVRGCPPPPAEMPRPGPPIPPQGGYPITRLVGLFRLVPGSCRSEGPRRSTVESADRVARGRREVWGVRRRSRRETVPGPASLPPRSHKRWRPARRGCVPSVRSVDADGHRLPCCRAAAGVVAQHVPLRVVLIGSDPGRGLPGHSGSEATVYRHFARGDSEAVRWTAAGQQQPVPRDTRQVCAARVAKAARCEPGPSWAKETGAQARSTQGRRAPTGGPAVQLETAILDSPGCTPRAVAPEQHRLVPLSRGTRF